MPEELSRRCQDVAELVAEALEWLGHNANRETVGSESTNLMRALRRSKARAQKLAVAARRNMCVGVFGPSQAGKSFLVSVLARPRNGKLTADFFDGPGGRRDFISEINPPGEGESTGLVTRFTMRRDACPEGFPIRLRLLTEADIARVLANTFLMDGDQSEEPPTAEEIAKLSGAHARPKTVGIGMSAEDVWDIREYLEKGFSRAAYVAALKPFWDEAAEIAPALSLADRAAFLSLLWGRHQFFTDLYVTLGKALAETGHATEVFAGMNALIPREESIIDVKTLAGLDKECFDNTVELRTAAGTSTTLPKPIVAALTAELIVPMAEQPSEMFAHTDLLDFPGARARFTTNLERTFAIAESPRKETFLRGKVAYLFDRYVAEQELTCMLLCVPPSNMEVTDLPRLVEDWVSATHGATPGDRAGTECILFFVFTKFDMHLPDNAATGADPETRWQRRIEASMIDPFGKLSDSWVNEWANGAPFRNSFWLRNPQYPAEAFIRYSADLTEIALVPEKEPRLDELRAGCLSMPGVKRHFTDPARAWDAAMALNDGGVSYLIEKLTPLCRPNTKSKQVEGQLQALCNALSQRLRPFYISDDLERRREEKRAVALEIIDAVDHIFRQNRFGEMLEALMVDPDRIADGINRIPDTVRIVAAAATPGPSTHARRVVLPSRTAPRVPANAPEASAAIRTVTREAFQAERAVQTWIDTMHEFVESRDRSSLFGMSPSTARALVTELIGASRRLGLRRLIEGRLPDWNFALSNDELSGPVSVISAEQINGFVARSGIDNLPPDKRPQVEYDDGHSCPAFQPRVARFDIDSWPAEPMNEAETHWGHWITALYALIEDNAFDTAGPDFDQQQNAQLGRILNGLADATALV